MVSTGIGSIIVFMLELDCFMALDELAGVSTDELAGATSEELVVEEAGAVSVELLLFDGESSGGATMTPASMGGS